MLQVQKKTLLMIEHGGVGKGWADQEIAGENRILPGKNIDALRGHVLPPKLWKLGELTVLIL